VHDEVVGYTRNFGGGVRLLLVDLQCSQDPAAGGAALLPLLEELEELRCFLYLSCERSCCLGCAVAEPLACAVRMQAKRL
jgi:hypothetical protein